VGLEGGRGRDLGGSDRSMARCVTRIISPDAIPFSEEPSFRSVDPFQRMLGSMNHGNIIRTFDAAKAVIVESRKFSQAEVDHMGKSYDHISPADRGWLQ